MDLGFTLTPDSMNSFNTAVFPLLVMSFFIIIGNTGFPIMLRFIIWVTSIYVPSHSGLWEELRFLLDHPRRCFTLLFPSAATWWLFWVLVILNGIDLIFFIILDVSV
jgi:Trk-type K+ transport system membrane component